MTLTLTEVFAGEVTRGDGFSAARMTSGMLARLEAMTGMRAMAGTLNLRLDRPFTLADRWHLPASGFGGEPVDGEGPPAYDICRIKIVGEIPGLAMKRQGGGDAARHMIEIVSPVHLRSTLGLEDGDRVRFVVVQ